MAWQLLGALPGMFGSIAGGGMAMLGGAMAGLGGLAGGVISGVGSLGGGLLKGAGSMLGGGRGGGGAIAPTFGAQPFAGGAPLSLPAPEASRALVPSSGGSGGQLDAAMGGALTVQQSQQDTMISLLQQIAGTVGIIAQNTAGLIGIETAQMSAQQEAFDAQQTQESLTGGETDDTDTTKRKWFSNPLGSTGQKLLDFAQKPVPAALGLFALWWWLRNNMDVFEKVLVPVLQFFKNLQEDPKGTLEKLKEDVSDWIGDAFTKVGHSLGNAVLDIFGFQFKDDKSWDIISQPAGKWDQLNPFTGEVTFWTAILDAYSLVFKGRWPDGTRMFKGDWANFLYPEGDVVHKWITQSKDEGFFKSLINLTNLKWPDGTPMFAFLDADAPWRKDFLSDQNLIIKSFKKDFFGLMEFDWFDKIDNWFKNDFRVFMENLVPSKETLAKLAPDIDWKDALANFSKFLYDEGPPEKFLNMDIGVLKNALPSITDIKQAWNKFWPGTFLDFKDVRTTEAGKWGGGSMIGGETGVQERASTIADLRSKIKSQQAKITDGDLHVGSEGVFGWDWTKGKLRSEVIKGMEAELTRMGVPPIVNAIDIGANVNTLKAQTARQADEATGKFNSMPVVIDSSTKSSTSIANAITQADLGSQNEENTARGIVYPRFGSLLGMAVGEYR